jgi:hypothetical protein
MIATENIPITSSELATLWVIYQKKTMMQRIVEYVLSKIEDQAAKEIFNDFYKQESQFVNEITKIFNEEGAVIPVGFKENDVNTNVTPLFNDIYDVMFLRLMMKIATGLHALHLTMTYRDDIITLYKNCSIFAEEVYQKTTQLLLQKGVLPKSPAVTMPKHVEFVKQHDYTSGFKLFGKRRVLNTIEVAYIYQGIEANVTGIQLMTGFGQAAKDKEVREYFFRGKELAKSIVETLSKVLIESDVQVPSTSAGRVTDSTESPFSDKLMMYNSALLSSFGLGSAALGSSFSLRSDLALKMGLIGKEVIDFAIDNGKIMIKNGWMEEPPQMEDRTELIKQ